MDENLRVELIYDPDCPNASRAREILDRSLSELGIRSRWMEWSRTHADAPRYVRQFGSPTVLVNGRDVAGEFDPVEAGDAACRLYRDDAGTLRGVPPGAAIVAAIRAAVRDTVERGP